MAVRCRGHIACEISHITRKIAFMLSYNFATDGVPYVRYLAFLIKIVQTFSGNVTWISPVITSTEGFRPAQSRICLVVIVAMLSCQDQH